MSVQVSYKKQTLLGIIGLLILILVVEAIANVWWVTQVSCEFEENEIFRNMDEEKRRQLCVDLYDVKTLDDELIPNQQSSSVTINSLGFRGDEFSPEKPDHIYRIFMLGGSTMFGHGATSDQTTIPGYTQEFFQNYDDKFKIEIINGGIQGADSYTETKIIENKLINYAPDMVIIYDGWNDLRSNNSEESIHNNWNLMCELGHENDFDVIIALQPIAGFGKKILTKQETEYSTFGTNYYDIPLINSLSKYEKYASNLNDLDNCTSSINLKSIFDNETSPIYWDQGHVSDKGNNIVAQALYDEILKFIPKDFVTEIPTVYNTDKINENKFENQIRSLLSNYKTSLMIGSIFSFEIFSEKPVTAETTYDSPVVDVKKNIFETQSKQYESDNISISVEIIKDENNSQQKILKFKTLGAFDNKGASHVTYFLKIFKNEKLILSDFFYTENEILTLNVSPNNSDSVNIFGERKYDHNALVASSESSIMLTGPIFQDNEKYELNIELRTIHDPSNWVFVLDNFHVEIVA
jgi:lysophospholipase L1-like esterase